MSRAISLVGLTGGLRAKSVNRGILRLIQELLPEHIRMEILKLDDMPFFNEDIEGHEPESVLTFREKVRRADGVFIVTPEHNAAIPAVLKNALDWASRPRGEESLKGKLIAIAGAGAFLGTADAQANLRHILSRSSVAPLEEPKVMITNCWEKVDEHGNLVDEASRAQVAELVKALLAAVEAQKTVTAS